uniref:Uncharacterized protein n=1 Tax=Aegilops tauschii subsp. strangulata TaxID=200361 RepID=A0A453PB15_AEGTS
GNGRKFICDDRTITKFWRSITMHLTTTSN